PPRRSSALSSNPPGNLNGAAERGERRGRSPCCRTALLVLDVRARPSSTNTEWSGTDPRRGRTRRNHERQIDRSRYRRRVLGWWYAMFGRGRHGGYVEAERGEIEVHAR